MTAQERSTIHALEAMHEAAWIAIRGSEEWADSYRNDPKALKSLVKAENALMRKLKAYFDELPNRVVNNYINWHHYREKVIKAYDVTVDITETEYQQEQAILFKVLFNDVAVMMALGSQSAASLYVISQPFTPVDLLVQKAAANLTTQLAESLTAYTKAQIIDSIKVSLKTGESIEDATNRMQSVIGDPRRAERIARTESVRSFSAGIVTYGISTGAITKTWQTVTDPCNLCASVHSLNENGTVGINESFNTLIGPVYSSPAHPSCRCGVQLNYPVDPPVDWNGNPVSQQSELDMASVVENLQWF